MYVVLCRMHHPSSQNPQQRTQNTEDQDNGKTHEIVQVHHTITDDDFEILASTARGLDYLETLEALYIRQYNPQINTKDEYRSRELTIKLVP